MESHAVRIGMPIKIVKLDVTDRLWNSNDDMDRMVGSDYVISNIEKAEASDGKPHTRFSLEGSSFVWASQDLRYAGPKIDKTCKDKTSFDPQNLIV